LAINAQHCWYYLYVGFGAGRQQGAHGLELAVLGGEEERRPAGVVDGVQLGTGAL